MVPTSPGRLDTFSQRAGIVGVTVLVRVGVTDGVRVAVGVRVMVDVAEAVAVRVGVGVG